MTSLLHASSRGLTQQVGGIKQLQCAKMSQISGKTMRAIADSLASHTSSDRSVALETLSCNSIGLEADAKEVYTAVDDVIALNLPSLHRLYLTGHDRYRRVR
jgi:Flp pilus assembly secretin CpaC